jgi:hypothetical protein
MDDVIRFSRIVDAGRDVAVADDIILRATPIGRNQVKVEGEIGGDVGRKLRVERSKRQKKLGRPGYPKPRLED